MKPAYYNPVEQSDDLDDPPVIVELVKPLNQNNSPEEDDWNKAKCAGVVGGLAGCFTGGFWLSVVCATGCIYAAKQEGTTSDIARACGTCAIKANVIAREVDEQYQVVDKSKAAAAIVWAKTKALNREHQLVEKTKDCIKSGVDYTREHKLVERTAKGMGTVLSTVAKELASNPIAEHGNETKNLASAEIMTTPDGTHDALTLV